MTMREAIEKMEAIVDKARKEDRALTGAEVREFNRLEHDFLSARIEDRSKPRDVLETRGTGSGGRTPEDNAFTHYLRTGDTSRLTEVRADGTGFSTAPNDAGVSAGSYGNNAGYLVPQGFWANLQVALKAYGGVANDFRMVETPTGNPMPWPAIDPTGYTGHVLGASSEITQLSTEQPFSFGQGMLNAWTIYAGPMLASLQLVQDSVFDVDEFVSERMGEGIGREMAALAISGTGSGHSTFVVLRLAGRRGYFPVGGPA